MLLLRFFIFLASLVILPVAVGTAGAQHLPSAVSTALRILIVDSDEVPLQGMRVEITENKNTQQAKSTRELTNESGVATFNDDLRGRSLWVVVSDEREIPLSQKWKTVSRAADVPNTSNEPVSIKLTEKN